MRLVHFFMKKSVCSALQIRFASIHNARTKGTSTGKIITPTAHQLVVDYFL